ncbi:Mitotic spindle-associated MMXD complex subunit MIP18 [Fasciolopsis buskii]|uniref:Mitotic spindle-associated MMXD complex subunit MIP18 n=1 Tax=Fasciolopsis buskii TaxID=27845 RepID=A0A8E0VI48_9TREM|nr:Mitotic spindle-associated MMXD complex subunit MIP18 [Fasciolopsis buski]
MLENVNPTLFPARPRISRIRDLNLDEWDGSRQPIDSAEVFEHIRDIRDPEHPHSLEVLGVVSEDGILVDDQEGRVSVQYTPTIPGCSMATLIGLAIKVKLLRSMPRRFKSCVYITPGSHDTEEEINKQLADKERVAAALENPALLKLVNQCLAPLDQDSSSDRENEAEE